MARPRRALLLPAAAGAAGALALAWMGLLTMAFTDYELEAEPALDRLRSGDVTGFLAHAPAYGGSLILRAPFALLPGLWGGGALALFRSMAAPCLAAGVLLGVVVWQRTLALGRPPLAAWIALGLCAANPLTLRALEVGHPEELLVGALCVGAMLLARSGRPLPAGLLVGLAAGAKPWALLAVAPVLIALPVGRVRAGLAALGGAAALGAPIVLGAAPATVGSAHASGVIFQPWQAWWFLGAHGHVVMGVYGPHPGYRAAPGWISQMAHPIVLAVPTLLILLWAWRTRGRPAARDGLLALALVLLLRCLLDPWNTSYYELPFLLALVTWEVHARRSPPWLSLASAACAWITLVLLPGHASPDSQALAYLAWSVPLAAALGTRLLAPAWWERATRPAAALAQRHLPALSAAQSA